MRILHLDADRVGDRIELLLLEGDLDGAARFSNDVHRGMAFLKEALGSVPNVKIELNGGDDLIASIPVEMSRDFVESLRTRFHQEAGVTISGGVGDTVQAALENLRRAKLVGRDRLIGDVWR